MVNCVFPHGHFGLKGGGGPRGVAPLLLWCTASPILPCPDLTPVPVSMAPTRDACLHGRDTTCTITLGFCFQNSRLQPLLECLQLLQWFERAGLDHLNSSGGQSMAAELRLGQPLSTNPVRARAGGCTGGGDQQVSATSYTTLYLPRPCMPQPPLPPANACSDVNPTLCPQPLQAFLPPPPRACRRALVLGTGTASNPTFVFTSGGYE